MDSPLIHFTLSALWFVIVLIPMTVYSLRHRKWAQGIGHGVQAIGTALNFLVVSVNGWRMPVQQTYCDHGCTGAHSVMNPSVRLPLLCDIFWGGSSLGDWFLFAGVVWFCSLAVAPHLKRRSQLYVSAEC